MSLGSDKPLHGGPVSPWPRRVRRFSCFCMTVLFTCVLAVVFGVVALVLAGEIGSVPVALALLVATVTVYGLAGMCPLTWAFAGATGGVVLAPELLQYLPELDRVVGNIGCAVFGRSMCIS